MCNPQLHLALRRLQRRQHVHFLDVCAWVMKDEYPIKAIGVGAGRAALVRSTGRPRPFAVVYSTLTRQAVQHLPAEGLQERHQPRWWVRRAGRFRETQGCGSAGADWTYAGPRTMYQTERRAFASIRSQADQQRRRRRARCWRSSADGGVHRQEITWEKAMARRAARQSPGTRAAAGRAIPARRRSVIPPSVFSPSPQRGPG
jgi:hypothetical protein